MIVNRVGYIGAFLFLGVAAQTASGGTAFQNQTATQVTAQRPTSLACDLAYSIAARTPGV